jgi:hypothetical protein
MLANDVFFKVFVGFCALLAGGLVLVVSVVGDTLVVDVLVGCALTGSTTLVARPTVARYHFTETTVRILSWPGVILGLSLIGAGIAILLDAHMGLGIAVVSSGLLGLLLSPLFPHRRVFR